MLPARATSAPAAVTPAMRAGRRAIMPFAWGKLLCLLNSIAPSLVDRYLARYA